MTTRIPREALIDRQSRWVATPGLVRDKARWPALPQAWWSALVMLPLWVGWSFGSLGSLQARQIADTRHQAEVLAATVRARLGTSAFDGRSVVVALTGHRCTCASASDDARWARALGEGTGALLTLEVPGAPYSTLAFDADGALRFAGSPTGAGCSGDPARLLAAVLDVQDTTAAPFVAPCAC